ncbi:hypothetical protein [Actinomadura rubteroloni]|uniref:hypothetical protein n=1 Tax=Actinomadura rubteroloni TaxID=1926885 RepID=UPI00196A921E|nr:hypothetical protein [Actinomadura rubteroloni]
MSSDDTGSSNQPSGGARDLHRLRGAVGAVGVGVQLGAARRDVVDEPQPVQVGPSVAEF